jgi:uncharacterized protein (DUF924 family)
MDREQAEILGFWLDEIGPGRWYKSDPALDEAVRQRFVAGWRRAARSPLDGWIATAGGALALMILLDQFPRNMFRGTAAAFSTDRRALRAAKLAIARGHDLSTTEPERQFFYLPLMHSEALTDQERCVRLIGMRMPRTGSVNLEHAGKHREVIRRFGRFPSRNRALGRPDTEAERAYRAEGGYMG